MRRSFLALVAFDDSCFEILDEDIEIDLLKESADSFRTDVRIKDVPVLE